MTRARILNTALYAPAGLLGTLALALALLSLPAWLPVAIAAAAWVALWVAVNTAFEPQIAAWLAQCPRHQARQREAIEALRQW